MTTPEPRAFAIFAVFAFLARLPLLAQGTTEGPALLQSNKGFDCHRIGERGSRVGAVEMNLGGTVASGPITLMADGHQYVAVSADNALYVFGLAN